MATPTGVEHLVIFFILWLGCCVSASLAKSSEEGSSFPSDTASQAIVDGLFQSWQSATTVFAIIAEIFSLILLKMSITSLSRYLKLKKKGIVATDNRNIGKAFNILMIATSLSLLAYYPLFVVYLLYSGIPGLSTILSDPPIFFGLAILSGGLVDVTIVSAFLVLLRRRQLLHRPESNRRWQSVLEVMIILIMTALTAVKTTLACIVFTTFDLKLSFKKMELIYKAMIDLFHVYTILYVLVIIDMIVTSKMLRNTLKKKGLANKAISASVCSTACFLLGTQALLRLAEEIILWMFPGDSIQVPNIRYDALNCVDTAVKFVTYTWALADGLQPFFPPRPKPGGSAADAEPVQPGAPQSDGQNDTPISPSQAP